MEITSCSGPCLWWLLFANQWRVWGWGCLLPWLQGSWPLFTKWWDVLPQDLVKSWSRKIRILTFPIALKFDRHATGQQYCQDDCQISERYNHYNIQSRGFETSRDLAVRRLTAQWIEALAMQGAFPDMHWVSVLMVGGQNLGTQSQKKIKWTIIS